MIQRGPTASRGSILPVACRETWRQRGIFQCQIHFSSSQATIWIGDDPFRYRILDHETLTDPDIFLAYPLQPYPEKALIPQEDIGQILDTMRALRLTDKTIYLRMALINLFNCMIMPDLLLRRLALHAPHGIPA